MSVQDRLDAVEGIYTLKWPKLKRDYEGIRVRTKRILNNGFVQIPEGTICTITYAHGGLNLTTDKCPHCGVRIHIRKVPERDVKLIGGKDE